MTSTLTERGESYILVLKCPDTKGVVAAVSGYLAECDTSIVESNHFNDAVADEFYMRTVFRTDGAQAPSLEQLAQGFEPIAQRFAMQWSLHPVAIRPRVLIAVSKFGHCLYDLLHRWRSGLLPVEIVGVVSNHDAMRSFVEWNGLPFHLLPVTKDTKAAQEAQILTLVEDLAVDLVVLARYMQILALHQHPSFVPAELQGGQALSPGLRARGEDHRRHRALRHHRSGRGADHRAGRSAGGPRTCP
jgi:formyltetrahydrofolate deformylase